MPAIFLDQTKFKVKFNHKWYVDPAGSGSFVINNGNETADAEVAKLHSELFRITKELRLDLSVMKATESDRNDPNSYLTIKTLVRSGKNDNKVHLYITNMAPSQEEHFRNNYTI